LAIELAAARTRTIGLEEIRERLDDRFSLLTSPSAVPLERHSTLRAAVDWSYRLLNREERALLQRLSVFRGSFDLTAAAIVCGTSPLERDGLPDLLEGLVDKSLVVRIPAETSRGRYFLLETLREFAHAQLGANKSGPLRDAHADYYLGLAEDAATRLTGPEQAVWFHRIRLEHDNLRKALSWTATTDKQKMVRIAVAMGRYWDSVGPRSEGHDWLRRAVEMSKQTDSELRVEALLQASEIFSSHHAALPRRYAEALAISERTGNTLGVARSLCALTWSLALEEDPENAIEHGLRALPIIEELDDRWELALCLERLGQAGYQRPEWSIEMLQRACRIYRELGDRTREALTLYKMADRMPQGLDQIETAREYAERAVTTLEEIGSANDRAHAKLEYGKILRRTGEPKRAIVMLKGAFEQLSRSGDDRCSARALTALGTSELEAGDFDAAKTCLRRALQRGHDLDEQHTMRAALAGLARLMTLEDRKDEAVAILAVVDTLSQTLGVPVSTKSSRKRRAILETLRAGVGKTQFDRLWERGTSMSLDEALEAILESREVV
jgi:tetratricopeptide (TPR) repeat protein